MTHKEKTDCKLSSPQNSYRHSALSITPKHPNMSTVLPHGDARRMYSTQVNSGGVGRDITLPSTIVANVWYASLPPVSSLPLSTVHLLHCAGYPCFPQPTTASPHRKPCTGKQYRKGSVTGHGSPHAGKSSVAEKQTLHSRHSVATADQTLMCPFELDNSLAAWD